MISLVTMESNPRTVKKIKVTDPSNIVNNKNNIQTDSFEKTNQGSALSFKGRQYPSGYYESEEISTAKRYIHESGSSWKERLFNSTYENLKAKRPIWDGFGRSGNLTINMNNSLERTFAGIFSLGLTEVNLALENSNFKDDANYFVRKISNLRDDLKNERLNEENEAAKISDKETTIIKEYENNKNRLKEESLKPNLLDPIQSAKEGKLVSVPNCIMLVGQSNGATNDLIEWTGRNVNGKFVQIDYKDNVLEYLKKAEENHRETGNRTLLHIRNFDNLLNPSITPGHVIADLKNLMAKASEKYKTTIIFSTQDPSKLNNIALQTHRVDEQIKVDFETPDEIIPKAAWDRVTKSRAETHPIATINDLLKWKNLSVPKLSLDHSSQELDRAATALKNILTSDYAKESLEKALGRLR